MSTALHTRVCTYNISISTCEGFPAIYTQRSTPTAGVRVQDQRAELTLQGREKSSRPDICLFKEWWQKTHQLHKSKVKVRRG